MDEFGWRAYFHRLKHLDFVLFVLMMSLISEEFKPQDKLELAAFEINPKVEDVQLLERETKITKIQKIETPPPPPQIERQKADRPAEPIASLEGYKQDIYYLDWRS